MTDRETRYWDAGPFIAWLKPEPWRLPACEGWLDRAERGKVLIVTSTVTLMEVVKLDHSDILNLAPETAQTIEGFFRNSWISLRTVDAEIAEKARGLMWDHGIRVRDAIHIATALRYKIAFLDTYDEDMIKLNDEFPDLTIGHPPQVPQQLSAESLMASPPAEAMDEVEAEFAALGDPIGDRAGN